MSAWKIILNLFTNNLLNFKPMETYTLKINGKTYELMVTDRTILIDAELHIQGKQTPLSINSFPADTDIKIIFDWALHQIKSHD